MKALLVILLLSVFVTGVVCAESSDDKKLRETLIEEGFGEFKFYEDNTYKYHYKEISESLDFSGRFKINSGEIIF